jgi:hypothetical protein
MTLAVYLMIGFVDTLAILAIMFKLFRMPFFEYSREVLALSLIISCSSYLLRVEVGSATLDMVVQISMYIGFLIYVIKIRIVKSVIIACAGYSAFSAIQLLIAVLLFLSGLMNSEIVKDNAGIGIFTLQIISELAVFLVSFVLHKTKWGWSYVILPPHDFFVKEPSNPLEKKLLVVAVMVMLSFIIIFIAYQHFSFYLVTAVNISCYLWLYLISRMRDYYDARRSRMDRLPPDKMEEGL